MNKLHKIKRNLERYLKKTKFEIYKECINERLQQVLYNYNNELQRTYKKLDANIDAYWDRKERRINK